MLPLYLNNIFNVIFGIRMLIDYFFFLLIGTLAEICLMKWNTSISFPTSILQRIFNLIE